MNFLHICFVVAISFFLISCSSGSSSSDSDTASAPTISAADKDTVAPCPNQSILTDATELDALKDALSTGALSFLDVPFDGGDPDIYKKKCGLEGFWDPANNIGEIPSTILGGPVTLSSLLMGGNAGICATGGSPGNPGFPAAGTYRGEIKAAKDGSTWHLRLRGVASGSSAGNTFAAEMINVPADIENTLEYKVNGQVTAHADLLSAMVGAASISGDPIVLEVSKTAGGASVFSISTELICVTKS